MSLLCSDFPWPNCHIRTKWSYSTRNLIENKSRRAPYFGVSCLSKCNKVLVSSNASWAGGQRWRASIFWYVGLEECEKAGKHCSHFCTQERWMQTSTVLIGREYQVFYQKDSRLLRKNSSDFPKGWIWVQLPL